jgi:phosphoribosylglycinamide formyltransferase 2
MNRDAIRDVAHNILKLKTARFAYAESSEELRARSREIGFPNVVKPVMSSSGKGQSVVRSADKVEAAWNYAVEGMRGTTRKLLWKNLFLLKVKLHCSQLNKKKERLCLCALSGTVKREVITKSPAACADHTQSAEKKPKKWPKR